MYMYIHQMKASYQGNVKTACWIVLDMAPNFVCEVVPLESPVNEYGCWNWWGYLNDTQAMEYGKPEIQA